MEYDAVNCPTIQEKLTPYLDGELRPNEQAAIEEHLLHCDDCQQLVQFVQSEDPIPLMAPPADLLSHVLAHTSGGPACEEAQRLVFAAWELPLSVVENDLLRQHTQACHGCSSVVGVAQRLLADLSCLTSLEPGEAFTRSVLRETTEKISRWSEWKATARASWQNLSQRPRIAYEGAFLGMIMFLVFYAGSDVSLSQLAQQTASLAQSRPLSNVNPDLQGTMRSAWNQSGGRALAASHNLVTSVGNRLEHTEPSRSELRRDSRELVRSVLDGNLSEGSSHLGEIRKHAGEFWTDLNSPEPRKERDSEGTSSPSSRSNHD